jgi:hypothetical protein
MARAPQEYDLQRAVCLRLDGNPDANDNPRVTPALRPGVVYWHTANSGEGRDAVQGLRLKQQGVKAGVHDLLFLSPRQFPDGQVFGLLYGLELKKPGLYTPPERGLSAAQRAMHARLLTAGMVASATADNLEQVFNILFGWGLTVKASGDSIRLSQPG